MDQGAWWGGHSPWGCRESDTTEPLSMHAHIKTNSRMRNTNYVRMVASGGGKDTERKKLEFS